jgi:tetratricopeptide (TPR) repeat protein
MKPTRTAVLVLAALLGAANARAQNPINVLVPLQPPPPPPPEEPVYDPLHAEKSIEVGLYYMKKNNYDAAIERFQDAAKSKPNFARPYLLMGEAYEKKGARPEAVKALETYLKILPNAPDADKVRKRIEKLNQELEKNAKRRSR